MMRACNLLLSLISTSVFICHSFQPARFIPSKISYDDAYESLQKWATSSAASKPSNTVSNVAKIIESDGAGLRAADYLIGRWFSTKSKANTACKNGKVSLNGRKIYSSKMLEVGDLLKIDFSEDAAPPRSAEDIILAQTVAAVELRKLVNYTNHILDERRFPPLHILYEDNNLAVVFKPSGIHSMKWVGTMKKRMFALDDILPLVITPPEITLIDDAKSSDSMKRPLPCHRLDARVSGCLIIAKTQLAMSDLSKQFESRNVKKEYLAILAGNLTETMQKDSLVPGGNIVDWTSSSSEGSVKRGRITDPIDGFEATTELEVLEVSPCSVYGALTTVALFPQSGRRHQLRRHCAKLGCPIVGDDMYHDAGCLPVGERGAAIRALSVGRVKAPGPKGGDEEGQDEEDDDDDASSALSSSPDGAITIREGVRKKVGIFLMCTALEFYQPIQPPLGLNVVDIDDLRASQVVNGRHTEGSVVEIEVEGSEIVREKIKVRCPEVPRFTRLKEKARKGYDWQQLQSASR